MMRIILAISASLVLGACWGAPPEEKILSGLCVDILKDDANIERSLIADTGTDLQGYCSCYAKYTVQYPERTALHKDVLSTMVAARTGGMDPEQAAKAVEAQIEAGEVDTFTAEQLDDVGDDFQDVSMKMEDTGSCPA